MVPTACICELLTSQQSALISSTAQERHRACRVTCGYNTGTTIGCMLQAWYASCAEVCWCFCMTMHTIGGARLLQAIGCFYVISRYSSLSGGYSCEEIHLGMFTCQILCICLGMIWSHRGCRPGFMSAEVISLTPACSGCLIYKGGRLIQAVWTWQPCGNALKPVRLISEGWLIFIFRKKYIYISMQTMVPCVLYNASVARSRCCPAWLTVRPGC